MKKILIPLLLILAFMLSSCSGTAAAALTSAATSTDAAAAATEGTIQYLKADYTDAVSVAMQLAVGTINLDGTEQTVTKDQAANLLDLWEQLQTLAQPTGMGAGGSPGQNGNNPTGGTSGNNAGQPPAQPGSDQTAQTGTNTAASPAQLDGAAPTQDSSAQPSTSTGTQSAANSSQAEIDALIGKIEALMTNEQLSAISAMQLTQTSVDSILKEKGYSTDMGMGGQGNTDSSNGNGGGPNGGGSPSSANPPSDSNAAGTMTAPDGSAQPGNNNGTGPGNAGPGGNQNSGNSTSGQGQPAGKGFTGNSSNMLQPQILNAVIQYLAGAAGVEVPTAQAPGLGTGNQGSGTPDGGTGAPDGGINGGSSSAITFVTATYTVDGKDASQSSQTYAASDQDTSAIFVTKSGKLTLNNVTVNTKGDSSSNDSSSFYGLNAGILVNQGGSLTLSGGSVTTTGSGANGVFSSGTGSTADLSNMSITASGNSGHAVMATQGGTMMVSNVNMTTSGDNSSAIATDRGGGTITVTGGTVKTSGGNSAGIYSTGAITVTGTTFTTTGAEAAVIEGANSITLTDSDLTSSKADKWGVMIYQSMSGDAEGSEGTFSMTGGSLAYTALGGPLFYVTNSTANILLKGVELNTASGILFKAAAGSWGNSGANGGNIELSADSQTMNGSIVLDSISTAALTLKNNSTLTGAVNSDNTARSVVVTLDASSIWNVTADSYLTCLSDTSGINGTSISNINSNGHTVYYDPASCSALNGKTYALNGGGTLTSAK